MAAISLVSMPFLAVERPSLAIGLFSRDLRNHGIDVSAHYFNLKFPEKIGLDLYHMIGESNPGSLLGEWMFSRSAFPDFNEPDGFLRYFLSTNRSHVMQKLGRQDYRSRFNHARDEAEAFVMEAAEMVLSDSPRIVACTSVFQQQCASLALLRRIKQLDDSVVTVLGGANCEGIMGYTLHRNFDWVDFVVSGEADEIVVPFFTDILEQRGTLESIDLPYGVFGPAHRRAERQLDPEQVDRRVVSDMDSVQIPDHSDYISQLEAFPYREYVRPGVLLETSRGCWWGEKRHCTFCGLNGRGMNFRSKSPQRVLDEFRQVADETGIKNFDITDNILDTKYFKTLLPELARAGAPYELFYETKANLQKSQLKKLAQAGIRFIQPGIESLSDEILTAINKGNTAAMNIQLLKWAREYDVYVVWLMLTGVPGENASWYTPMQSLIPRLHHLQPPSGMTSIQWERYSPYHNNQSEYGLALVPKRGYNWVYPLDEEQMLRYAYFFEDSAKNFHERDASMHRSERNVMNLCSAWQRKYIQRDIQQPRLEGKLHDDGRVSILDDRSCAIEIEATLDPDTSRVLLACDRALKLKSLIQQLDGKMSESRVLKAIEELDSRALIANVSERIVGLVVFPASIDAVESMPDDLTETVSTWDGEQFGQFPGGTVDIVRYSRSTNKASKVTVNVDIPVQSG